MQKYIIDAQLAQAIANYLGTRPYVEVAGMIAGLQRLEVVKPDPAPVPTDTDDSTK